MFLFCLLYGPRGDGGAVGDAVGVDDVSVVVGVGSPLDVGSGWVFLFLVCFFSLVGGCGLLLALGCAFVVCSCVASGSDVCRCTSSSWEACMFVVVLFRVRVGFFGQVGGGGVIMLVDCRVIGTLEGSCSVSPLVGVSVLLGRGFLVGLLGGTMLCRLARSLARSDRRMASCIWAVLVFRSVDCHPSVLLCWFAWFMSCV